MDFSRGEIAERWLRLAIRADVKALREIRSLRRQRWSSVEFFEMLIQMNLYELNQRRLVRRTTETKA